MAYTNCNDQDALACLDALIKEINDELSVGCQIPFTVPKKELSRIVERSKDLFYKIYEDSVEEMYIALPKEALMKPEFKAGIYAGSDTLSKVNTTSNRGVIPMPNSVFSVNAVFEWKGFAGEDGGFSNNSFSKGDKDFSIDKFIFSDTYGAGIGSENLMYYVINAKFVDVARQILLPQISYQYNRLTHKLRFMGELPKEAVVFQIYNKIPDCALFQDEIFIRYCAAKAKMQLGRILGTFTFNLPGNVTINYDMIASEGKESDEGTDYFLTG
jgi:hypothetical protein